MLVNSNSAYYGDFQEFIQPYLDNFGVPYVILNLAYTPVTPSILEYALIIIGHRQIDAGGSGERALDLDEQAYITAAVNSGVGLINFDNDLSADGSSSRYPFIQDIFGFGYTPAPSGSGVQFTPAAGSHYITARHQAGEAISTGSMTLAGITLPEDATLLAASNAAPFLAVRASGQGRAVQWGTYNWISITVKGPVFGLDDLVWRSMAWAARKPFAMQGMPPFVTMRVDDGIGPFDWIRAANEVGIKPWTGIFLNDIDETNAKDLSSLANAGMVTVGVHSFSEDEWFYWHQSDTQVGANFLAGTDWFKRYNMPMSKFVSPHFYHLGTNVFNGLAGWGVECTGTILEPGKAYGAPWVMEGPYHKFETGASNGALPLYYADYLTIPEHPELNGKFFNMVTEIRDDLGYEWYPTNEIENTIKHGTIQVQRALDSLVLATLFTHEQSIQKITLDNWKAIMKGIAVNLAPYNPIFISMDDAYQYIKSKFNSKIAKSAYNPTSRQITVNFIGNTVTATMFHLFLDDKGEIQEQWVDVPQFSTPTQVQYQIP